MFTSKLRFGVGFGSAQIYFYGKVFWKVRLRLGICGVDPGHPKRKLRESVQKEDRFVRGGDCSNTSWMERGEAGNVSVAVFPIRLLMAPQHTFDMRMVDLSYNLLDGLIPENLGQLKSLQTLNLNSNKLSGRVPGPFGERLLRRASFKFVRVATVL
ncbi:hypothetical protein Cgig2_030657 [Carnegiea gigantea]|uniref:Uncharacterized protein n=1 Tax=Carnegiea gigantea TaxID=171969 RepID=A0A9Q1K267_9CARY|nr:hypothetical protein Cgig2_030657 [Carnegiea gigantea]